MIKTFTQTDLIRYLYRETTEEEKKEIDRALICDGELRSLFDEVCAAMKDLDAATLEPSEGTVSDILKHARSIRAKA